ncbi:MAG: hypothetical protein WCA83_10545, partial [Azonexus sp.]
QYSTNQLKCRERSNDCRQGLGVLGRTIPRVGKGREQLVIGNDQLSTHPTLKTFSKKANFLEQSSGPTYLSAK